MKQQQTKLFNERNPPPLLKKKELTKRVVKVLLERREDVWATEFPIYVDPRDDRYQAPLDRIRQSLNTPGLLSMETIRDSLGIPMPPIRMVEKALAEMRGTVRSTTRKEPEQTEEDTKGKKR